MITISDSAAERLKEMLAEQETPNMFLRLCHCRRRSGFSYAMGFDDQETEADVHGPAGHESRCREGRSEVPERS